MNSGLLLPPPPPVQDAGSRSFRTLTAAHELAAQIAPISQCIQMTPGRVDGSIESVHLAGLTLYETSINRGIELRFLDDPNALVVGVLLGEGRAIAAGQEWDPSRVLLAPESQVELTSLGAMRALWLRLERERVSSALGDGAASAASHRAMLVDARRFDATVTIAKRLLQRGGVHLERELETALVATLRSLIVPVAKDSSREMRSLALVRSVETYMWENVEEPLTLERICSDLHCGIRGLIYAFKDIYGVGPMTYWKACRLNGAHRALRASMGMVPILEIAADYGFWHMGHFSADHKHLFGMTPSEAIEMGRQTAIR
ncbi:MAG TPA: helix-turn-helix domain-containing protein [Candidatus Aquilonibacter sp.]|nr:helix-turn-helix domain-containing protein [Candidatus Aquilonibacter sp.]